jgi:alcohol dehydrogenase
MKDFTFHNPTKIIFGKNSESKVGEEIAKLGKNALLVYGGGSIKKTGLYNRVSESLSQYSIPFFELEGIKPNPRLSSVREGILICREKKIEAVLAVGGGSVIDAAKAVAFGAVYEGDVWDFFMGKLPVTNTLPLGVVLTLPGTGSESSFSCVVTNEDGWYKRAVNIDSIRPKFAILNPELTYTLSQYQSVCGAFDAITHALERYFTPTENVYATDRQNEAAIKSLIHFTPEMIAKPKDYDIRAEILWLSKITHDDSMGAGRQGDFASHRIAHEIGAMYDVAHGATLSIIFPAWMKYVYKKHLKRFVQYAVNIWDVDYSADHEEAVALKGIEKTEDFLRKIGLPIRLSDLEMKVDRLEEMAEKCTMGGTTGNMIELRKDDVINVLNLAR